MPCSEVCKLFVQQTARTKLPVREIFTDLDIYEISVRKEAEADRPEKELNI
jgi:hypothetical protein